KNWRRKDERYCEDNGGGTFGNHTQRYHRRHRKRREPEGGNIRSQRDRPTENRIVVAESRHTAGEPRFARPVPVAAAEEGYGQFGNEVRGAAVRLRRPCRTEGVRRYHF